MAGHHLLHERLDIRLERQGDTALVLIAGACDVTCHEQLRDRLLESEAGGARRIIVDMTCLSFIDTSGLRAVIGAWNRARHTGQEFLVALAESGQVRRVFELTGAQHVLPMETPHTA
jgi:anti-sigma B factor antagonist